MSQDAREQARHQIAVMQAWVDGKVVQISEKDLDVWEDYDDPAFNWGDYDYRVKPEERKPRGWIGMWTNGRYLKEKHPYTTDEAAAVYGWHKVDVVEVLPSENTGGEDV